jgi:hypothetical protein
MKREIIQVSLAERNLSMLYIYRGVLEIRI